MSDERTAEDLAYELAGELAEQMTEYHMGNPQQTMADRLLTLIRTVFKEELGKVQRDAEAAHKPATQTHWDSPVLKSQVDALRRGGTTQCPNCKYDKMRADGTCSWCGHVMT